jgi:hypothetical protein
MRSLKSRLFLGAALLAGGFFFPSESRADNCSGGWTTVTQVSETTEVGKGHTVTSWIDRSSSTSDDSPFVGVGPCSGYSLTTPDGKTRMAGICARKTKDGSFSYAWALEPGAERGAWTLVGGTGVLEGKTGSGWWQPVVSDGKTTTGIWGGTCN